MKKGILGLILGFLLIGMNVFAADGDLIVEGNVGVGTTDPAAKLDVQGGPVKIQGIFITHVTGTNPTCPSGTGVAIVKKFVGRTCTGSGCSSCTLQSIWAFSDYSCGYTYMGEYGCYPATCTPTSWTEVICMGN